MDNQAHIGSPSAPAPTTLTGRVRSLPRLWQLLAAGLVIAGLLLALAAVLRHSVQQAQARHADAAARAEANFRCNTVAGREQRSECRARASGTTVDSASSRR